MIIISFTRHMQWKTWLFKLHFILVSSSSSSSNDPPLNQHYAHDSKNFKVNLFWRYPQRVVYATSCRDTHQNPSSLISFLITQMHTDKELIISCWPYNITLASSDDYHEKLQGRYHAVTFTTHESILFFRRVQSSSLLDNVSYFPTKLTFK